MRTLTVILMLLIAIPAAADTYKWEDDQGTLNFTEDLGKIPKKFRKKAQKIGDMDAIPAMATEGKGKASGNMGSESTGVEGAANTPKNAQPLEQPLPKAGADNKTGDAWKADIAKLKGDLKAAEAELAKNKERLDNPSGLSQDGISMLQSTIKNNEIDVINLKKQLDALKQNALKAGVPAESLE